MQKKIHHVHLMWSIVFLVGILPHASRAQITVDQSYVPTTGQGFNSSFAGNLPIGQTFTPTLNSLSFVDLYIGDAGSDIGPGASFEVKIHSGSIGGPF
jgi:hypothetical protein